MHISCMNPFFYCSFYFRAARYDSTCTRPGIRIAATIVIAAISGLKYSDYAALLQRVMVSARPVISEKMLLRLS